jgi:PAS domain S-box-containing protein
MRQSLVGRIVAILLCVAVVPLAAYMAIAIPLSSQTLVEVVADSLANQCELVASDIDGFLQQRLSAARLLSQADTLESDDVGAIRQYLAEAAESDPAIGDLYVVGLQGSTQATSRPDGDLVSDESRDPCIVGKELIAACVSARQGDVLVSEAMPLPGGSGLLLATPVTDDANQVVVKVLLVEIPIARIQDIVSRFDDLVLGDKFVYVLDQARDVVTSRDPTVASWGRVGGRIGCLAATPQLARRLAESSPSRTLSYRDAEGDDVVAGYADISAFGVNRALKWSIIAVAPVDEIWMPVRTMRNRMLTFGLLVTLGTVGLAGIMSRTVTAPMRRLNQAADQMRQGKYDIHLPATGIGEVDQVYRAFDATALAVADRNQKLSESVKRYRALFENMNAGFVLFEVVQDKAAVPVDLVIVAVNEEFEFTTGLKSVDVTGKRLTQVLPGVQNDAADWIGMFGKIALTGEPRQVEQGSELLGRDFMITAYQPAPRQCAVTFSDVTQRKLVEEQLRRKEHMVSSSQDMMALLDRDYVYLAVNDAYLAAFGKTHEEVVGRTVSDVFGQEFFASVINPHAQRCFEGQETRYRAWFEFPIHGRRHMDVAYSPYEDKSNQIAGFVVCARDITEQKMSEKALSESEERLRLAMRAAGMGNWDWDLRTGKIVWSEGHERLWGMPPGSFHGTYDEFDARVHPEDRPALAAAVSQARESQTAYVHEFRIVWPDGSSHWIEGQGRFEYDESGAPIRMTGVVRDITVRRQAEESLRASEAQFRAMCDVSPMGIFLVRPDGHVTYGNASDLKLTGLTWEDTMGLNWVKAIHPEDRERALAEWSRAIDAGQPYEGVGRYLHEDGKIVWWDVKTAPVEVDGQLLGFVGIVVDISDRVERERELEQRVAERTRELKQANEDLDAYAHSVAHDLRAPLRAMFGFARALREDYADRLDEEGREYTEVIESAAHQMDELTTDLLEYSQVGRGEFSVEPVDLDDVLEKALEPFAVDVCACQADLHIEHPLGTVVGHGRLLVQVVSNLVANAMKFVAPGAKPEIRIWSHARNGSRRLWIEDNGIGIAPRFHAKIFQVFERLHGIETYAGTGIGLAIVRRAVESMGGQFGVESSAGAGSRFWVEFPAGHRLADVESIAGTSRQQLRKLGSSSNE